MKNSGTFWLIAFIAFIAAGISALYPVFISEEKRQNYIKNSKMPFIFFWIMIISVIIAIGINAREIKS